MKIFTNLWTVIHIIAYVMSMQIDLYLYDQWKERMVSFEVAAFL